LNLKSFHMSPFCNPLTRYCVKEDIIKYAVTIIIAIWFIFNKIHLVFVLKILAKSCYRNFLVSSWLNSSWLIIESYSNLHPKEFKEKTLLFTRWT
jgi:hypothetical protein